jgi:hypothetical protein
MSGPLDDVQDRFEVLQQRLSSWRDAVFGLVTEYDGDPADGRAADDVLADDFYVHLVVGVPEDATEPLLDDVVEIVDEAAQLVVQRLFDAGYTVPEWGVGRGDLDMGEAAEEAT